MRCPEVLAAPRSIAAPRPWIRRIALLVVVLASAGPAAAQFIRLEDVVAGGDGSGSAPPENTGIHPGTGAFTTDYFSGRIFDTDGVTPSPVPGSPYIDSVFILKGRVPTAEDGCSGCFVQYITRSGVQLWLDDSEENGSAWNYILKDRNGGVSEPGIDIAGIGFGTAVGIHSSMGITFDLQALRARHGDSAVGCFSTFWGMDGCAGGLVKLLAMVADQTSVTDIRIRSFSANQGEWLTIEIPHQARYLTLVSVASGSDNCDHGTFGRPIISPSPCQAPTFSWVWNVSPSRVSPAGEAISLMGEQFDLVGTVRVGGFELSNQARFGSDYYSGVTPPLAPGFYDLEVFEEFTGGVLRLPRAIEVAPPPALTSISPADVLADRAMPVVIRGSNLRSDMIVAVDDTGFDGIALPIENLTLISETEMRGATPRDQNSLSPGAQFQPQVLLRDQGRLHTYPDLLTYHATGIEKVEPSTVSTEGGTLVTFAGANFTPGMRFELGGIALQEVVLIDSGHARGTSPPLPAGSNPAQLVTGAGALIFALPDAVEAVPPGPLAIASVSPARVFSLGGAEVTIVTTRPAGNVIPWIGGVPLANVRTIDALTLRGEIAPLAPGFKDIDLVAAVDFGEDSILTARGAIEVLADDQIRITAVDPAIVSTLGGTEVTVSGSGFSPGFVPRIGGAPLEEVRYLSTTSLRAVTAPLAEGPHDASIASGKMVLATLPGAVAAVAPAAPPGMYIGHIRPARISPGTSRVRFVGTQFPGDLIPRIGGVPLAGAGAPSPCRIEGTAPNLPPGFFRADLYRPGFGVVARFDELVEVADPNAPPRPTHLVSEPVLRDGSTRVFIFGNDYSAATVISVGGRPLVEAEVVSDELIIGRAPALDPGEALGLRDIVATDPRGSSRLPSGLRYVAPAGDGRFVRADANVSGQVDISDAVTILGFLFLGDPVRLDCLEAADVDGNGATDITDPIALLEFLFLGGRSPAAPFPECGLPAPDGLGCASYSSCGGGGGGAIANFLPHVKLLAESASQEADPRVVEIAAEEGEIVIHDPPGGKEVEVGDVIAGFTPFRSDAIHNGVTYMLKVEQAIVGSCLEANAGDKVFRVRPATLAESLDEGNVQLSLIDLAGARVSRADRLVPILDCFAEIGGGGGDVKMGGGGAEGVFFDVDFGAFGILDLQDGDNYLRAGFYQSQVRYNSGINIGFGIKGTKLKRLTFFAGQLLESQLEFYVDAGLFTQINKEVKLLDLQKGTIIFIGPVPVLVTASVALYAGVNLDAGVTLYVDAGTAASYKAGIGFEFDGTTVRNISGFEPPSMSPLPDTPVLNVDGFASVKGTIRPEFKVGAGLLIKALTGEAYMLSEMFGRAHVEGHSSPPCFQWGFDAGAKVTLQTEVQLFGYDLFDHTYVLVNEEWPNLIGGEVGCKAPPVVKLKRTIESTPTGLLIHLDASESYDPDGGPLNFRWDLNDDGKCVRNTGQNPRTTFAFNPTFNPCLSASCEHVIRLRVTDDEKTYAERTTSFTTVGEAGQIFQSQARLP